MKETSQISTRNIAVGQKVSLKDIIKLCTTV